MSPKDRDENAKDPAWKTPNNLTSVGKGAYDATMEQSGGKQGHLSPEQANPSGKPRA